MLLQNYTLYLTHTKSEKKLWNLSKGGKRWKDNFLNTITKLYFKEVKIFTNPVANPVGLKLSKYSCKTTLTMKISVSVVNAVL